MTATPATGIPAVPARRTPTACTDPPDRCHPSTTATIWIVDDHQLVASSLAATLRAAGHPARCPLARTVPEILAAIGHTETGLVLLDLELGHDSTGGRIDGVALVHPLREAGWQVLALTDDTPPERIGAALVAGAAGAIGKTAPLPTLLTALHAILTGRPVNPPAQRRDLIELHQHHHRLYAAFATLTTRERETLDLLVAGRRTQTIAAHHVVSVATVRTQIRAVLTKLGVNSQLEAVALYNRYHRTVWPGRP